MTSTPGSYGLGALAEAAGLPVGTVKYYLREGLLPPGRLRSATRADYDDEHLRRLRLLRLLREVGEVPIDRLRGLVEVLESGGPGLELVGSGVAALAPAPRGPAHAQDDRATRLADDLLAAHGWALPPGSDSYARLTEVLATALEFEREGPGPIEEHVRSYARVADELGASDIAAIDADDPADMLAQVVVGKVVYGRLLDVLRDVAEAHHAVRRWGGSG
ncbi:MerR family transcriptional regulator [Rhodococcus aerolatus]